MFGKLLRTVGRMSGSVRASVAAQEHGSDTDLAMETTPTALRRLVREGASVVVDLIEFVQRRVRGSRKEGRLRVIPPEQATLTKLAESKTTIALGQEQLERIAELESDPPPESRSLSGDASSHTRA